MTAANKTRCFLLLVLFYAWGAARAQDVIIVVNRDVQVSQISSADLRDIFTGVKSRFRDGSRVVPVVMKGGPAHEVFLRNHIRQSPEEFRTAWRKAVFTGQAGMLKAFDSEDALVEFVAATPGAIGYVSRISPQARVKALAVVNGN
jgi:ABC-type phosphate transport system substrate-binding protein